MLSETSINHSSAPIKKAACLSSAQYKVKRTAKADGSRGNLPGYPDQQTLAAGILFAGVLAALAVLILILIAPGILVTGILIIVITVLILIVAHYLKFLSEEPFTAAFFWQPSFIKTYYLHSHSKIYTLIFKIFKPKLNTDFSILFY